MCAMQLGLQWLNKMKDKYIYPVDLNVYICIKYFEEILTKNGSLCGGKLGS